MCHNPPALRFEDNATDKFYGDALSKFGVQYTTSWQQCKKKHAVVGWG